MGPYFNCFVVVVVVVVVVVDIVVVVEGHFTILGLEVYFRWG